jgi:hypothetical protein
VSGGGPVAELDLGGLGFDRGGHLLLARALAGLAGAERLEVRGTAPGLDVHLRAWCRARGHPVEWLRDGARWRALVGRGPAAGARWRGAERAGGGDPAHPGAVAARPRATWGVAARGALVEPGGPSFPFSLDHREEVWTPAAAAVYRQAAAAQWDPATAVPWDEGGGLPAEVEAAVVQVMTFLVENENAALAVPARFLGQLHPHFREVVGALAVQVADEARHVEVFTRRATLNGGNGGGLGLSTAAGQASLLTLLEEPDYAVAHFLLSVLGEGTFLSLLSFLETHGPDPVTRRVTHLALVDEARHVAFGMAHVAEVLGHDPGLRERLAAAVRRRHRALAHTAGLNEEVFDALVVLAAGSWAPEAVGRGHDLVTALQADMADGRRRRLVKLGFPPAEAADLAGLHTRSFM